MKYIALIVILLLQLLHYAHCEDIMITIAGTGNSYYQGDNVQATSTTLYFPCGITLDTNEDLYIADFYNQRVRKVRKSTGVITTIAGTENGVSDDGGEATAAALLYPFAIAVDTVGILFYEKELNLEYLLPSLFN